MSVVTQGEQIHEFPLNNMNTSHMPKLSDVPRNNYDDRAHDKVNEKARIAFNKQRIGEAIRSRNTDDKKSPRLQRKSCGKTYTRNEVVSLEPLMGGTQRLQIFGNSSIKHLPKDHPVRVSFQSKKTEENQDISTIHKNDSGAVSKVQKIQLIKQENGKYRGRAYIFS